MAIKRSEIGFKLEGVEPRSDPAWTLAGPKGQAAYWREAAKVAMPIKLRSIVLGIGTTGEPVANIKPSTRRRRRSAMTKSGKGSPSAAPLVPGYTLSRAYAFLRAIPQPDGVWFQWKFDRITRRNWGEIMAIQKAKGRDHIGFSFDEWDAIVTHMDAWWKANRARLGVTGAVSRGIHGTGAAVTIALHNPPGRGPRVRAPQVIQAGGVRVAPGTTRDLSTLTAHTGSAEGFRQSVASGGTFNLGGVRRTTSPLIAPRRRAR